MDMSMDKKMEIPDFKKAYPLKCKNYQPVSMLNSSSKLLKRLYEQQLKEKFLNQIYHANVSAYHLGYSCQHVLLDICGNGVKQLKISNLLDLY